MAYDLIVLGILLFATIRGAAKGMAWQLAAIATIVLCFLFATPLSVPVAQMIQVEPPANRWIAMGAIYIVFSLLCFGAARGIRGWLESVRFVEYDRHLGAIFGLLKGALFCLVMTFFLVCVNGSLADYVLHTKTGYVTALAINKFHTVMPAEIDDILHRYIPELPAHDHHGPLGEDDDHDHFVSTPTHRPAEQGGQAGRNQYRPAGDFRGSTRPSPRPEPEREPIVDIEEPVFVPDSLRPEPRPAEKDPLSFDSLVDQVTDVLGQKLQDTVNKTVKDLTTPQPAAPTSAGRLGRAELTDRITALFSSQAEVRQSVRNDIDATLDRVPRDVAEAALRDWYGDLMGHSPDADPETDVTTDLATRVDRQRRD